MLENIFKYGQYEMPSGIEDVNLNYVRCGNKIEWGFYLLQDLEGIDLLLKTQNSLSAVMEKSWWNISRFGEQNNLNKFPFQT